MAAPVEQVDQGESLVDTRAVLAMYGGEKGLTYAEIVDALASLREILAQATQKKENVILGLLPSVVDNLLSKAYLQKTGHSADKSNMFSAELPPDTPPALLTYNTNGNQSARTPAEQALYFIPLGHAKMLAQTYGSSEEKSGLTPQQLSEAVAPLAPIAEKAKIKMFLGLLAEGFIRSEYRKQFGTSIPYFQSEPEITASASVTTKAEQSRRGLFGTLFPFLARRRN